MATYHLSIKSGKKGKAFEHSAYIAREGKHGKNKKGEDLLALEHGNLPSWAADNPAALWKAADRYERANGAAYREFELALPKELSLEQNLDLVREFVKIEIGTKPFQFAIHAPTAALGDGQQPHAHIINSDREPDTIDRPPEQHFRRHNSAHPELGGCKKDSGGKDPATLKEEVKSRRARWAALQNKHLEMNGHATTVDHRSNRERGIDSRPERHLGSAAIKNMTPDEKTEIQAKRQTQQSASM